MALSSAQPALSSTPTQITDPGDTSFESSLSFRATTDCYIGPSNVSTSTGFLLKAGEVLNLDRHRKDAVYAVVATTATGYVLRTNQ